jgi:tripartite-type tricarboxylate transporter receptor subunit TctC
MKTRFSAAFALLLALPLAVASAADFPKPDKPVRILVGLAPGGPTDLQARIVAQYLGPELGSNVLVENRPGASMTLAASEVARSAPDGHTLLYSPSSPFAQSPYTMASLPFDPFKDFTPISLGGMGPLVLVAHKSVPAENLQQLVAYARANPGKLSYGSFGTGTSSHLFGQLMAKQYGLDMVHIPYKGTGDVQKDLLAGRIQIMFAAAGGAVQFVRNGNVRMLGVAAPVRTKLLPGVPTLTEQGAKGLDVDGWLGFFGPAKLPPATVARLNAALSKVLAMPQVKEVFEQGAYEAAASSPAAFESIVKKSYIQWGTIVRSLGTQKE